MNARIRKKKWKQAAARSRAERLQEIESRGKDDPLVIKNCFAHFLLFGDDLLGFTKDPILMPQEVRNALDDAVLYGAEQ